jgi:putative hydrolase of the HAD superfamily
VRRRLRAVLFDLDDTLYPEMDFVRGGFRAVAAWLAPRIGAGEAGLYDEMLGVLEREGRGKVFDAVLRSRDAFREEFVRACLWVYRSHRPALSLHDDAASVLSHLRREGMRLGIVTDGMGAVQRAKVESLGIESMVDAVVCSDLLGPDAAKPAGHAYRVVLETLAVGAAESAYVGDNPRKDFLWPNANGMTSIRIRRPGGPADPEDLPDGARARYEIATLTGLPPLLEE